MSLYPSVNLFPANNLYPAVFIKFDFTISTNYNSIKTSTKNASLLSDLENTVIGGRERTSNVSSLSRSVSLSPSKIKGNKIK